ncbi:YciE/YciF ferroxidase family protein [Deminuibacter soli]|uniref:Ferritin-like domain-containing protein n=1 Tax=Deminuibacter soli TaxID=2291815 RepID=A0A3E1NHM3_9BACT|nr:ferritin-like domain-containing protein [Deminuibacter soli]RFM27288.1 ferritin-like domain-containing protein [Deminuibacter soli]
MEKKSTTTRNSGLASNATKETASQTNKKANTQDQESNNHPKLQEFFVDSLKDIYWAEKHLVKALGKLQKAATTDELKNAFGEHQSQTEEHVTRLEQVFEIVGEKAVAKKCEAMDGITKEADSIVEETEEDTYTRDVALIMAAQKAEHYEIATYGTLVQLAKVLQYDDAAELLNQTLEEEKETDQKLTDIAESNINNEAE